MLKIIKPAAKEIDLSLLLLKFRIIFIIGPSEVRKVFIYFLGGYEFVIHMNCFRGSAVSLKHLKTQTLFLHLN